MLGPLGSENAPVAEAPPPKGGAGVDGIGRLGLPNIWVNSPACAPGRLAAGVGVGACADGCHWFPAGVG